mmetsp:Transcript_895/g.1357  ORF Transcript_895/g.1357 Transcript_895/m.1357 type:complete len:239 (-) Transcript_895:19-735(-)
MRQVTPDLLHGRHELGHAAHGHIGLIQRCIPAPLLLTQPWQGLFPLPLHLLLLYFQLLNMAFDGIHFAHHTFDVGADSTLGSITVIVFGSIGAILIRPTLLARWVNARAHRDPNGTLMLIARAVPAHRLSHQIRIHRPLVLILLLSILLRGNRGASTLLGPAHARKIHTLVQHFLSSTLFVSFWRVLLVVRVVAFERAGRPMRYLLSFGHSQPFLILLIGRAARLSSICHTCSAYFSA